MIRLKDNTAGKIHCLDLQLQSIVYDFNRLAELSQAAEEHPDDAELAEAVRVLRSRLNSLLKALEVLTTWEKYLLHLHYEKGWSFRKMQDSGLVPYSYSAIQKKVRAILKKVVLTSPNIT